MSESIKSQLDESNWLDQNETITLPNNNDSTSRVTGKDRKMNETFVNPVGANTSFALPDMTKEGR